ncbi:glycoside hydrolase family protein [Leptodesmis sichuanensis]|uniref:glycoside hydrolase family protein n=1 Tax=Leptodesmis sichuanensis TaxID=2906798 RepID=UPI001F1FE970|nr:glycoside hydrolase family protein [Leptodesmis sichuanensis]UIE38139.1 glycoside hydrolase family protein [Leptodesmis sichuanensis A121]
MKREQYLQQQNHASFQPQSVSHQSGLQQSQLQQPANRSSSTNQLEQGNSKWLNAANNMAAGVLDTVRSWIGAQGTPDIQAIPQVLQKNGVNLRNATIEFKANPNSVHLDVETPKQGSSGRSLDIELDIGGIGTRDMSRLRGSTIDFTAKPNSVELDIEGPQRSGRQAVDLDLNLAGVGTQDLARLSGAIAGIQDIVANLPRTDRPQLSRPVLSKNDGTQILQRPNSQLSTKPQQVKSQPAFDKSTGHINQAGLDIVKQSEGFRSQAYRDAGGKWTIGYGHTATADPGETVTRAQAESLLKTDLRSAENAVRRQIQVPLNSNQFSALTSLAYNIGEGGLKKSDVAKHLNAGNYQAAADSFNKIVHVGGPNGTVLPGLVTRRANERALFLKPDASEKHTPNPNPRSPGAAQPQSYTVKKGDTLSEIAQNQLGDANRWRELQKADGSTFSEQDARKLQPGTTVFMPGAKPPKQEPQPNPGSSSPNQKVVDIARDFLHVREHGKNSGREVEMFQRDMRGNVGKDPWCMQFAQYCIKQAGGQTGQSSKIHRSAGCLDVWRKSPPSQKSSKPEVGSLVIFGGSGHVGIVEKVNANGSFTTIEGNTRNPNGSGEEGVFRKEHKVGEKNIVGFLRPF